MDLPRETTLYQNLDIPFKKALNALAIDSTGSYAALGGKKGLYIVDLEEPWDPPKLIHHGTRQTQWDPSVIQWNPHSEHSNIIASAANKDVFIWNLDDKRSALQATFVPHSRPVADLSWSISDANVLATCSADTYVNIWDIRNPRSSLKLKSFCAWIAGASSVKWNRRNPRILASTHEGEVFIWDLRKESSPICKITAHRQISSMDWSYHSETQLVTSSLDRTVKFWDTTQPNSCQAILQTGQPVSKVKYSPFGRAILTVSQKSDFSIRMWNLSDLENPLQQFLGHKDVISSIDWRICDVEGDYEYQIVSWSKDLCMRLWMIDSSLLNAMAIKDGYQSTARTSIHSTSTSLTTSSILANSFGNMPQNSLTSSVTDQISSINSPKNTKSYLAVSPSPLSSSNSFNNFQYASSPSTSTMLTSSTIKTLEQEFAILSKRQINGVVFEEMSLQKRSIQLKIGRVPYILRIKITFPSMYPNLAAPSFDFLSILDSEFKQLVANSSALYEAQKASETSQQNMLSGPTKLVGKDEMDLKLRSKQLLLKVASAFVAVNLVCIEPCCNMLLSLLETFHSDPKLMSMPEDPDQELPIRPEEYYRSYSLSSGSVPSKPSRSAELSKETDSDYNLSTSSGSQSSSTTGNTRNATRLTFSESGSNASSHLSTIAFSPPRMINGSVLPDGSQSASGQYSDASKLPKAQSDVNLSRFLDTEYLQVSGNTINLNSNSRNLSQTPQTKMMTSQSTSNLSSLIKDNHLSGSSTSSSYAQESSFSPRDYQSTDSRSGNGSTAQTERENKSKSNLNNISSNLAFSPSSNTDQSKFNNEPSNTSFATIASHREYKEASAHVKQTSSSSSGSSEVTSPRGALVNNNNINNNPSYSVTGYNVNNAFSSASSVANEERNSISRNSSFTSVKSDKTHEYGSQSSAMATNDVSVPIGVGKTTDIDGSTELSRSTESTSSFGPGSSAMFHSHNIPVPRTFGASFYGTSRLLIFGKKEKEDNSIREENQNFTTNTGLSHYSTSNSNPKLTSRSSTRAVTSVSRTASKVRTYDEFLEIISNPSKTPISPRQPQMIDRSSLQNDYYFHEEQIHDHDRDDEHKKSKKPSNQNEIPRASSMNDVPSIIIESMEDMSSTNIGRMHGRSGSRKFMKKETNEDLNSLHKVHSDSAMGSDKYIHTVEMSGQLKDGSQDIKRHLQRTDLRFEWTDSISCFDVSFLVPVSESLAVKYNLSGDSISSICRANAVAAKAAKRKDLVKIWSLLEQQTCSNVYPGFSFKGHPIAQNQLGSIPATMSPDPFIAPWAFHPFGRKFIKSVMKHYEKIRDVQTLAMISCVLVGPTTHHGIQNVFPSVDKNQSTSSNSNLNQNTQNKSSLNKLSSSSSINSEFSKSTVQNTLSSQLSKSSRNLNVGSTFDHSLIDPALTKQFNSYRRAYADMLYLWGRYCERARILKYVGDPTEPNQGIDFVIVCDNCSKLSKTPFCQFCKSYGFKCDICHIKVRGLSIFCLKCGHGGHADHMKKWFEQEIVCPTGCGCACLEADVINV